MTDGDKLPTEWENGEVIVEKWRVEEKLGEGGFGTVYRVKNLITDTKYAMKVESTKANDSAIKLEVAILKLFRQADSPIKRHSCRYFESGETASFRYMVMELVGPNLSHLRRTSRSDGRFSNSTTVRVGIQCLESIEALHRIGFLHRDIKPANYAIGRGDQCRLVYILDYGLGRQYVTNNGYLRPERDSVGFRGTVRYASVSAHSKKDLGRRDDLWSLLYLLIEFRTGQLPWRKVGDKNEVGKLKNSISTDQLLNGMEPEFHRILNELCRLQFYDTPNYGFFYGQLRGIMQRKRYGENDPFDWEIQGT